MQVDVHEFPPHALDQQLSLLHRVAQDARVESDGKGGNGLNHLHPLHPPDPL